MGHFTDDSKRAVWVGNFFVRREYRGAGIGAQIWKSFWAAVQEANPRVSVVGLSVVGGNPITSFYERQGFKRIQCSCEPEDIRDGKTGARLLETAQNKCPPPPDHSSPCVWDRLVWTGRVDTTIVESKLQKLLSSSAFTIHEVPTVTDELLAFDREITGHKREQFLRTLSAGSHICIALKSQSFIDQLSEKNSETQQHNRPLVGYSAVLELENAFLVLFTVAKEPETAGIALLLSQLQFTCLMQNSRSLATSQVLNSSRTTDTSTGSEWLPKPVVLHTQRLHMPLLEPLLLSLGFTQSLEILPHLRVEIEDYNRAQQNTTLFECEMSAKGSCNHRIDEAGSQHVVLKRMIGREHPMQEILVVPGGRFMI